MNLKSVYLGASRFFFYLATTMFFLVAALLLSALIQTLPPDPALAPGSQSNVALAIVDGRDEDPLIGVYFRLDLDGKPVGYFTKCSHIGSENEVIEHTLSSGWVQKPPGKLSWYNMTLSRGITTDTEIWEWRRLVEEGNIASARGLVQITILTTDGTEVAWWELTNAWPCRIEGPGGIEQDYVSIEEVEIACERMERVTAPYSGPEMIVKGNSFEIVDGDVTPSPADGTDFGTIFIATGSVIHTFIIKNIGTSQLNLAGDPRVTVSGACASEFIVTAQPASTVAANGGSTSFEVTFDPSAAGVRTATISITNDDSDENPFDIRLSGNGGNASFSITKTGPSISKVGDNVSYIVSIINTGQVTLITDNITDSKVGDITGLFHKPTLMPGDSDNATYDYIVQAGDSDPLINMVTAYYHPEQDAMSYISGSDNCPVDLVHPYILVTKYVAGGAYKAGDTITYLVLIDNTSTDITLVKDSVIDSFTGDITGLFGNTIPPGGSDNHTYTYTVKATDPDPLLNDVTAHYHPDGLPNDITDTTHSHVNLLPTITSVTPSEATQGQTLDIIITGTQLNRVTGISFPLGAGLHPNSFTVDSPTQITANISVYNDATPGSKTIKVANIAGTASLPDAITVKQLPQSMNTATNTGTVTFSTSAGGIYDLTALTQAQLTCGTPPYYFPHGFFSFNIHNIPMGSTVTITIILPSPVQPTIQYWKCQNGSWVNCTSLLGDNDGDNLLTLTITDGGLGDADGVANGSITDPGGPCIASGGAVKRYEGASTGELPVRRAPPDLKAKYISVNPKAAQVNQPITITTNVVNEGEISGSHVVALTINGKVEQTQTVTVGPGATRQVSFTVTKAEPGSYQVSIGNQRSTFVVANPQKPQSSQNTSGLVMALATLVLIFVSGLFIITLRRRMRKG